MSNLFETGIDPTVYTVTQICNEVNQVLGNVYKNLFIQGEISGLVKAASGHCYFSIKDDASIIPSVMFRYSAAQLKEPLENGKEYIFGGGLRIYNKRGVLQFEAVQARSVGMGNLHLAFEQLKIKLSEEGLFDESRKKRLPYLPGVIGIITSPTGAVIHDMQTVIIRKFPNSHLRIYPAKVQGETAVGDICRGIAYFNDHNACDVMIIARGGGSFEELSVFNNEELARMIHGSTIPVISAIGHETDFTICDFVADIRAATPTAAAEMVVPNQQELIEKIAESRKRTMWLIRNMIQSQTVRIQHIQSRLSDPLQILKTHYLKLDDFSNQLSVLIKNRLNDKKTAIKKSTDKLYANPLYFRIKTAKSIVREQLFDLDKNAKQIFSNYKNRLLNLFNLLTLHNPATLLKKGFVRIRKDNLGERLLSVDEITVNSRLNIEMRDGLVTAKAEAVKKFPK